MRALVVALVLALALPAAAQATPFLEGGDATELANALAEATEEQGICYGWSVYVSDQSGGPSGSDTGSSFGPGVPVGVGAGRCDKGTVVLEASVTYTCDSCESEDSSDFTVRSSMPGGPTKGDVEDLDLGGGQLKGDKGDVVLVSMVGALPLIVASKGLAPALSADTSAEPPKPPADKPTGTPTIPDWLRESWLALAACLILLIAGAIWLMSSLAADRQRKRLEAHRPDLVQEP